MGQKAITWDKTRLGDLGVLVGTVTLDDTDPVTEEFAAYDVGAGTDISGGRWRWCSIVPNGAATQFTGATIQIRSALDATNGIPIATASGQAASPTLGSSSTARPGFVRLETCPYPSLQILCAGGTGTKSQAFKIYLWR